MSSIASKRRDKPAIPPFWQRLPQVLAYPMNGESLLAIALWLAAVTACFVFGVFLFIGFILMLFAYCGFLKYCFSVLSRTARGYLTVEDAAGDIRFEADYRPYKQFALFFVYSLFVSLAGYTMGPIGGQLALLVGATLIPAAIMILALEEELGAAIHPSRLLDFVRGIGLPYFALVAFLFLMLQGSSMLGMLLGKLLPAWLAVFLAFGVNMYFTVAMYYLMGYVLFQYHNKLDVAVDVTHEEAARSVAKTPAEPPLLGPETLTMLESGDLNAAAQRIAPRIRGEWDNHKLHDQFIKILVMSGDREALERHCRAYLPTLVNEQRLARAVEVFETCHAKVPDFTLRDGDLTVTIAQQAYERNRIKVVMSLVNGFDKRFPQHAKTAQAYLLGGRIQLEHLHQYEAAKRTFAAILKHFGDSSVALDAEKYLRIATQMAAGHAAAAATANPR